MKNKNLLQVVNSLPEYAAKALENVYRGKLFVVGGNGNTTVRSFCKTERGAKGYINKNSFSYYDEYFMKMVDAGEGLTVEEIDPSQILDPKTSKQIWYNWMYEVLGRDWMYNNVLLTAKYLQVSEEVMEYVEITIAEMKRGEGLRQMKEEVTVEEVAEEIEQQEVNATPVQEQPTEQTEITVRLNDEKNGIEIVFADKPSQDVLEKLNASEFKWSRRQKLWYAKQSPSNIEFANSLADNNGEISESEPVEYEEIDIEDVHTYVVPQQLQQAEHNANWITRKSERNHTAEVQDVFTDWNKRVTTLLVKTENQRIAYHLKKALQACKKSYFENYLVRLRNRANNPSIMVTGRSGRNMNALNKANDRYNNLIQQASEITDRLDKAINRAVREINKEQKERIKTQMESMQSELEFTTERTEITMCGVTDQVRAYRHGSYMIAKTWGCFRIFKDGREIKSMKTTERLDDAKKYVAYLANVQESAS